MAISPATRRKAARLLAQGKPRAAADVYRRALKHGNTITSAESERELLALIVFLGA